MKTLRRPGCRLLRQRQVPRLRIVVLAVNFGTGIMTLLLTGCVHRDEFTGVADPAHRDCIEGLRNSDGTVLRCSARDSKMLLQTAVSVSPEPIEVLNMWRIRREVVVRFVQSVS